MHTQITHKQIWRIAYPIILGSIVQNIISVTDTAFLGHVGEVELGAAALGGVFYLTLIMLALGFSIGTQIIVARRFGERQWSAIGTTVEHTMAFLFLLAGVVFFLMRLFGGPLFQAVISSEVIYQASKTFLMMRIWGLFFAYSNFAFRAFYIGIGHTRVITFTTAFMAVVNVVLDYALIFGHWGFPKMGLEGAALASVIAEASALLFFMAYTRWFIRRNDYGLFRFSAFNGELFGRIFRISLPMMMQNLLSFVGWFCFFIFVEKMGEMPLAISNVVRSIYVIMLIPIMGFSSATNTLVSQLIGQERTNEVPSLVAKIMRFCLVLVIGFVAVNMIFPEQILSVYSENPELIAGARPVLRVVSISALFLGTGLVLFSGVSGTGSTQMSFIIEAVGVTFYVGLTWVLTYFVQDIAWVWAVEIYYGAFIGSISYLYLLRGNWRNRVV